MITHQTNPMRTVGAAAAAPTTTETSAGAGAPAPADVALVQPLQCQLDAARFATQRGERREQADRIRANGRAAAIALLRAGRRDQALSVVRRAWVHQLRTLGMSYTAVEGLPYDEGGPLPGQTRGLA